MSKTDIRELKTTARLLLDRKHAFFAGLTIFLMLADLLLTAVADYAFPANGSTFNTILFWASAAFTNIIYYLLLTGVMSVYLNLVRGSEPLCGDLLFAFKVHPEPVAIFSILQYAVQFILVMGGPRLLKRIISSPGGADTLLYLLILAVLLLLVIWVELNLSMVLFLYCDDPQKNIRQLLEESMKLIAPFRSGLLYMYLSFAAVYGLGILSFGIGLLYARPYLITTKTQFYLTISSQNAEDAMDSGDTENI